MRNNDNRNQVTNYYLSNLSACGGTFTEPTGELTSPFWPEYYPHSKQCLYAINAPEGKVIKVTFENFAIEAGESDEECRYDSLVVSKQYTCELCCSSLWVTCF